MFYNSHVLKTDSSAFLFSLACSRILGSLSLASFSLQGIESSKFTFNFHVSRTSAYFKNKIKERNLDYSYLHVLSTYFGLWRSCVGVWKITPAESSRIACLRVCVRTCMCRGMRACAVHHSISLQSVGWLQLTTQVQKAAWTYQWIMSLPLG